MTTTDRAPAPPRVVAIGLSNGDLDEARPLLEHLPQDPGLSFLVVHDALGSAARDAAQRLQAMVKMPLREVVDTAELVSGTVFIAPPDHELRLDGTTLRTQRRGAAPQFAYDELLLTLAAEIGERATAVVMAATARNAYRGMRGVKEAGGLVVLQRTATGTEDPDRALAQGTADYVLDVADMPRELQAFAGRTVAHASETEPGANLDRITGLISERTGVDFSDYKTSTVLRRIERRMAVSGMATLGAYADLLARSPTEAGVLYHELLIGVTRFFRDPEAFAALREKVLKPLLRASHGDEPLRVWVAACSTGEEAYTVAILLQETMRELDLRRTVKIFATDLDRDAIQFASAGSYPHSIAADIPPDLLERWFVRKGDRYVVAKALRELVVFAPHNIQKDPPFYRIDLITCRNLLIYLQSSLQRRLFTTFHFALNPEGYLMLGSSETLGEMAPFFVGIEPKSKLYRKLANKAAPPFTEGLFAGHHHRLPAPSITVGMGKKDGAPSIGEELEQAINSTLLREFMPAFLVVNESFEIAHVFGEVSGYLKLPVGKPSFNLLKMAPRELAVALGTGIRRALTEAKEVVYDGVEFDDDRGQRRRMHLVIKPFPLSKALGNYVAVVIKHDGSSAGHSSPSQAFDMASQSAQRIRDLELEVQQTSESLQAAIEELETANEELQATNEEVLAANEELQSTNEELQSVNEELYTVNAEHQAKITELTELNNDILNFLASTNIGTVFLDAKLCVRKFTPAATAQINLMDRDIGRPLEHISNNLKYGNLVPDAAEVLRTLVPIQREVMTRDGRWYLMRLLPYRTEDDVIKGVLLTFIDLSEVKSANESIRKLTLMVENSTSIAMLTDAAGTIEYVNRRFVEATGWTAPEAIGRNPRFLRSPAMDADELKRLWTTISAGSRWQGRFLNRAKDGREFIEDAVVIPMQDAEGQIVNYLKLSDLRPSGSTRA